MDLHYFCFSGFFRLNDFNFCDFNFSDFY